MKSIYHLVFIGLLAASSFHCSRRAEIYEVSKRKISVKPEYRSVIRDQNKQMYFVAHGRSDTLVFTPVAFVDTLILTNCNSIQNVEDYDNGSLGELSRKGAIICSTEVVFLSATLRKARLVWDAAKEESTLFKNIDYSRFYDVADSIKQKYSTAPQFENMAWKMNLPNENNSFSSNRGYSAYSDSIEYFVMGNQHYLLGFKFLKDTTLYMRITH